MRGSERFENHAARLLVSGRDPDLTPNRPIAAGSLPWRRVIALSELDPADLVEVELTPSDANPLDDRVILALKRLLSRLGLARFYRGLPEDLAPGHLHVFDRRALRRMIERRGRLITLRRDPLALAFLAAVAPGDPV